MSVPSGYPDVSPSVLLWGPTASLETLDRFFDENGTSQVWGLDCKTSPTATSSPAPASGTRGASGVTALTIATRSACLVWDVAGGGMPPRLRAFLDNVAIRKCRVSADGLVQSVRKTTSIRIAGVLDLRRLHTAAFPQDSEVSVLPYGVMF